MGIYLNPDNEGFQETIHSEIYVDKTELIAYTNRVLGTQQKYVCVSRPRRFGKSIAAVMLAAYYCRTCESRALFQEFKIANHPSFEKHLNQYNVISLNMQRLLRHSEPIEMLLEKLQEKVSKELRKEYAATIDFAENDDLIDILEQIGAETGNAFIFIIDEWDYILREKDFSIPAQTRYLKFLRDLLKDAPYVKLAYMTGILPIKKYGSHSALNMFSEFSMTAAGDLAEYVGFTESEVKALCEDYNMDFQELSRWYDGYRLENNLRVYNPKAVVECLSRKAFGNYWTSTETYEALKLYIDMDFDGLREAIIEMLGDTPCQIDPHSFHNDMSTFSDKNDVLTLLVHLGYLTYNADTKEVSIPNEEVRSEFLRAITKSNWSEVIKTVEASKKLLENTLQGDAGAVARGIDLVHTEMTSILQYNDENALSCVISLAYYSAREEYWVVRELPTGKGFADLVFLPLKRSKKPALVVELKWNQSAEGAIRQIKNKNYVQALESYTGEILLVGINYDKDSKSHQCTIESYLK